MYAAAAEGGIWRIAGFDGAFGADEGFLFDGVIDGEDRVERVDFDA